MAKNKKGKSRFPAPAPPQERVDADLVEKDANDEVQDEAIAAGPTGDGGFYDPEAHEEAQRLATATGATAAGATISDVPASSQMNPYVSQEEQGMEMRPAIVGPPAYGSPDAITTTAKLLPLHQHPLAMEGVEGGAAISEDYGQGYDGTLKGTATVTSSATAAQTAGAGEQAEVEATDAARDLAEEKGVDLTQIKGTGKDGAVTKPDVEAYLSDLENQE